LILINCLNGIFPSFDSLNCEFSPGSGLVDLFSSKFSFHQANCKDKRSKATHLCKLNNTVLNVLSSSNSAIVVSDTSIRNNIATFIAHIYSYTNHVKKTLYHAVGNTFYKAKLFAIRCGINQAVQIPRVSHIIVITNSIHIVN